ncbi:MAG: hypothetical protein K8R68_06635, partial [Bacteroidales bacterium]|nr:hypothetical protein [Bacteroidales bacterium]
GKKVFIYFDGSHKNFNQQIRSGIAQSIVNQLLYGKSIGSQVKNTSLFPFPDWYLQGLVSYISEDWNSEIDNWARDGIVSGKFDKFNQLTGKEARFAGHAFWRYIAEKYGESSISNILYMAKVSRRLESGFLYILGISFKNLVNDALTFYKEEYYKKDSERDFPEESILKRIKSKTVYNRLKLSPDGKFAAYTSNRYGKYRVWLMDLNTGKRKKLKKAGFRLDEKIDYSYPLLAWHPSGRILSILVERKGEIYLYYYIRDEKKMEEVILYQFEKVLDYAYSPDGRSMIMSAVQRGQSDIFIYDIGSNSYEQITKDHYDDLYPRFINNSKEIIFSSNRLTDTIRFEKKYKPGEVQKRYDLFLYKLKPRSNLLRRVTNTPLANEIQAMEYENNYIAYLSDENGIFNRYIAKFDSTISFIDTTTHYRHFSSSVAITDYSMNILDQDVVPETSKYGQIIYKDRKYRMQIYDRLSPESLTPLKLQNTPYMDQLENLYGNIPDKGQVKLEKKGEVKPEQRRGFYTVKQSDVIEEILKSDTLQKGEKFDISNYEFDKEDFEKNWDYTIIDVPLPGQKDKDEPPKRINYNVEYFLSEIVTQIDFSFLNQMYQPFTGAKSPIFLNP